jgi:hypothetical protein
VRQHLEDVAVLDHGDHLGQVAAHRRDHVDARRVQQPVDAHQPAVDRQRVQRPEHAVDRCGLQVGGHAGPEEVRLARLDPGPDAQLGVPLAGLPDGLCVEVDVDRQLVGRVPVLQPLRGRPVGGVPDGEVQVLGEGHGGQADVDGVRAGAQQGGPWAGVPRELGVHVVVRRQHRPPSNRSSTATARPAPDVGAAAYGRGMSSEGDGGASIAGSASDRGAERPGAES